MQYAIGIKIVPVSNDQVYKDSLGKSGAHVQWGKSHEEWRRELR